MCIVRLAQSRASVRRIRNLQRKFRANRPPPPFCSVLKFTKNTCFPASCEGLVAHELTLSSGFGHIRKTVI